MATTASVYNFSRTNRQILKRHRRDKPSLILHLHNNHFRFERQVGMFLFDSPVKAFLQYIRDQKVPADLMDVLTESGVEFFEGCLIVEVHDHRSHTVSSNSPLSPAQLQALSGGNSNVASLLSRYHSSSLSYLQEGGRYGARSLIGASGPSGSASADGGVEIYRIVLHPTSETLWSDLKMLDDMNGGIWSDQDALQVEAKILNLTAPPLCLTPDPQATRISNLMLSATAPPSAYTPSACSPLPFNRNASKKRGANSIEMEKEELNRQRREKIMRLMENSLRARARAPAPPITPTTSTAASGAFVPTFGRMAFIEKWRTTRQMPHEATMAAGSVALANGKDPSAAKANGGDKGDDAGSGGAQPRKPPPKKKKKPTQKEKEEAEAAAAAQAKKKEEEEQKAAAAAAAAAAAPKSKKKKAQLEKERKEREEKEKAEREKAEKDKAAAEAKPKSKSKKKQKEEAEGGGGGGGGKNASPAKANGTGASTGSKKPSPAKKNATAPLSATSTPVAASKKPAASKASKPKTTPAKKADAAAPPEQQQQQQQQQGGPVAAPTPMSVQSTPTQQPQQIPQQMFMQPQQNMAAAANFAFALPGGGFPMQQQMGLPPQMNNGLMLPGVGFPMMPQPQAPGQPQAQVQAQQGQAQNGQATTNDLPVGVGLAGLGNWGNAG